VTGVRRGVVLGLALALVLGLAACAGEAEVLDRAATEQQVARVLDEVLEPEVGAVTCPDEPPVDRAFRCEAELGEERGTLTASVRYDEVDGLAVEAEQAVLAGTAIADELRAALAEEFGRTFQVDCGDDVAVVREPGEVVVCRARDEGSRRSVDVTVVDASGSLAFEVIDP
jgi:hypothetical protein